MNGSRPASPSYPRLVDVLRRHAIDRADKTAVIVLADGETEHARLTYADLDRRAQALAARMQGDGLQGERVVILLPTGVEYVVSYLACLYAGAVPVPLNPVSRSTHRERVSHVMDDCRPALAIVPAAESIGASLPEQYGCKLWSIPDLDEPAEHEWAAVAKDPQDLAYLQYTSGSTSQPRGVVVTHDNLMHQLTVFAAAQGIDGDDVVVTWLPLFHDFGLIGGLLMPLMLGATVVMLPPASFVQRPVRWLDAISRYGASASFSPNFGLDLCHERVTEEEKRGLNLDRLRVLTLGAEPIRPDTLDRFAAHFAPCGFRLSAFRVGFGMAEGTLALTLQPPRARPRIVDLDADGFGRGVVQAASADTPGPRRRLVSNGPPFADTELLIVEPDTRQRLGEGREGEVWLRGRSITAGYWNRPEETEATFAGRLADGTGPFLRSGDLGALIDGELYLTSRRKDLIIIRGRNHHPQDLELTITDAHPALSRGKSAAFSVDTDGEERLVVVQEVKRTERGLHDLDHVARLVRGAVTVEHDVTLDTLVFVRPATLPLTTSGKVRRQYTKQLFLSGELKVDHIFGPPPRPTATIPVPDTTGKPEAGVADWLRARVAAVTGLSSPDVALDVTFGSLGLDSATAVRLSGELATWLGRPVDPTLLYSYPTIAELSAAVGAATPPARLAAPTIAPSGEPVAVIGMACAFPGADSLDAFWTVLAEGRDAITAAPSARPAPTSAADDLQNWLGGFLDEVDGFDAQFFGISADEAAAMDPQQRLLLHTVWRALEDAGIAAETIAGTACGVFVGIATDDYRQLMVRDHAGPGPYTATGTSLSAAAGRLSYFLDLHGPSLVVDTACSSSLVAVHHALESLRRGESDLAIVAGVNLMLDPDLTVALARAGMTSPTGRCRTFDSSADGYVRGEGCGVIVLKRQSLAETAHDPVRALLVGSAVNQDGRSNTLTAPNGLAQQAVMRLALASARRTPEQIGYVEAHGTGTSLGDPIEMAGLAAVYGTVSDDAPLWVGSVKTNIGHLEAAAGIAGLIKVILAIEHAVIPPNLHLDRLNPLIALDGTRCRIPTKPEPWIGDPRLPRSAAVSSFGFTGTNAHVILEAPAPPKLPATLPAGPSSASDDHRWQILPISTKSEWAHRVLIDAMAETLDTADRDGSASLAELGHAARRRTRLSHRTTVVARTSREAAEMLREHRSGTPSAFVVTATVRDAGSPPWAWLFPGQGFQRPGMAGLWFDRYEVFRDALSACDRVIRGDLGVSLLPTLTRTPGDLVDLDETRFGQPAMFAVQYALASVWRECTSTPDYLLGHSLGEYAAACMAGVLTLDDALGLVMLRSRLMQQTPPGAMYAVHTTDTADLLAELSDMDGDVVVAAINGPDDVTISGTEAGTERMAQRWLSRGARVTRLGITRACHSPLMETVLEPFARQVRSVSHRPATVPLVSSLTGQILAAGELTAEHWVRQLRQPVRFAAALRTLDMLRVGLFVEMSPEPVLSALGPRNVSGGTWLGCGQRGDDDDRRLVISLAQWYTRGGALAWDRIGGSRQAITTRRVSLPGHPLRTTPYWYTPGVARPAPGVASHHPLVNSKVDAAGATEERFAAEISAERPWFIDQHRILGVPVLPGTAMIEWARAAAAAVFGDSEAWTLDDVRFTRALVLPKGRPTAIQAAVDPRSGAVACYARDGADTPWQQRAQVASARPGQPHRTPDLDVAALIEGMAEQDVAALYARIAASGIEYGPAFRSMRRMWASDREAIARITVDRPGQPNDDEYVLDPLVLDACLHMAAAFVDDLTRPLVPVMAQSVRTHGKLPTDVWCHARWSGADGSGEQVMDLRILSVSGESIADIDGLRLRPLPDTALVADSSPLRWYVTRWVAAADLTVKHDLGGGSWLVVARDRDLAQLWQSELTAAGAAVSIVAGDTSAEEFAAVVDQYQDRPLSGLVIHAGSSTPDDDLTAFTDLVRGMVAPVGGILAATAAQRPAVVLCSTYGVALPGERPRLAQSAITGLALAMTAEYPDLLVVQVDADTSPAAPGPREILARALAAPGAAQLAVRDGRWMQARLAMQSTPRTVASLRPDTTYLITGGWGALGRICAVQLAAQGARNLVLVGRQIPEPMPAWIADLRRQGVEILLREVDVADSAAVGTLIGEMTGRASPLRGIVHAAGSTDDAALSDLDWPRFARVLDPKAGGAWNLHQHTRSLPLDFFVLFSSFSSMIGSAGQANYVVANAFLDALAAARVHEGLAASSLNWGPWSAGGIAVRSDVLDRLARSGVPGIAEDEGATALLRALADGSVRVGLAKVDWERYAAATARKVPHALLAEVTLGAAATLGDAITTVRPPTLTLGDPEKAQAELTAWLLDETATLMGLSPADREELRIGFTETRFNVLGVDSLMAVRLRDRIISDLSVMLPTEVLFDGSTVGDIVSTLYSELAVRSVLLDPRDDIDDANIDVIRL